MFTEKGIKQAVIQLYELFDEDDRAEIESLMEMEIEDFFPDLAAALYDKLSTAYQYRMENNMGECLSYYGGELFGQRAAFIMRYYDISAEENGVEIDYASELWLLEDMNFAIVHVVRTEIQENEAPRHISEYRKMVTTIEDTDDLFFTVEDFLSELEDICMFYNVQNEATIYEL